MKEYAKFVRVQAKAKNAKGFSAYLTLPNFKSMAHEGDFINFYCGLGPFECGISTKQSDFFSGHWHWFANASEESKEPINMSAPVQYKDGQSIRICLMIDETDGNKIKFLVNGRTVHRSKYSYRGQDNGRIIIACAQATPENVRPLDPWGIFHSKVTAAEMKYKNGFHIWRPITPSNTFYDVWRLPAPELVPDREFPEPRLYAVSPLDNSSIRAELKNNQVL